jgi:hypothetical protein
MMASQIGRTAGLMFLLASCGLALACGDDGMESASGGPQNAQAQPSPGDTVGNRAPEITAMRFEPAEASPGKLIQVHVGTIDADRDAVELGHTWTVNNRRTANSGSTFEVPSNLRKGDTIEVSVTASDGKANSVPSVQALVIGNRRPTVQEIRIHIQGNEDGQMGRWVADPTGQDPDGDEISFRYSWILNGKRMSNDTAELDRSSRRRGDELQLVVWAMDGESESAPLESAPFTIENSAPDIDSRPPPMDPSGLFAYSVKASDRDGDRRLRYSLPQGPDGMEIDAFTGELRWQATYRHAGEHMVEIAVDDRQGGVTTQTFYVEVSSGPASPR